MNIQIIRDKAAQLAELIQYRHLVSKSTQLSESVEWSEREPQ